MRRVLAALTMAVLSLFAACDKEKIPEPAAGTLAVKGTTAPGASAASTAAGAPAAAAPAAAPGALPAAENIPVAADFEDEAEKSITKANYKTELDSLEAEIK